MQNMEQIYEEYSKQVYKYLFCLTHNDSLSEELTQETFYLAVKNIHRFRGDCKIYVWLCQIAKNLWYKELKKKKKKEVALSEIQEIALGTEHNLEEQMIETQETKKLYEEIAKLDEITRQVIYLRITGEMSFKEIGEIMQKSETWARVTFYRGKQKIKESGKNEE